MAELKNPMELGAAGLRAGGKGQRETLGGFRPLTNPIPAQVTDPGELQEIFKSLPLIPYSSNRAGSGHRLLKFFEDLSTLSVTNSSVITEIIKHAFGGELFAEVKVGEVFGESVYEEDEGNALQSYNEAVTKRIGFDDSYRSVCKRLGLQLQQNGNMAILARRIRVGGEEVLKIEPVPTKRYLYTSAYLESGVETVAIFDKLPTSKPEWQKGLDKGRIKIIPVWPNVGIGDDENEIVTFFHFATTDGYYGRPSWEGAWMDAYREFQDRMHLIKESDSEWVGRVIIEVEDPPRPNVSSLLDDQRDQEAGFSGTAERMAQNFTRESDNPQSFMITNRPAGAKEMKVTTISPMTNENFWEKAGKISQDSIIMAHGWSRRLMGQEFSTGFSREAFLEELKIKNVSSILPFRNTVVEFVSGVINWFLLETGSAEAANIRASFKSPYQQLIDDGEEMRANDSQPIINEE